MCRARLDPTRGLDCVLLYLFCLCAVARGAAAMALLAAAFVDVRLLLYAEHSPGRVRSRLLLLRWLAESPAHSRAGQERHNLGNDATSDIKEGCIAFHVMTSYFTSRALQTWRGSLLGRYSITDVEGVATTLSPPLSHGSSRK